MIILKDKIVFANSRQQWIFNYIVDYFKIDLSTVTDQRILSDLEDLIDFIWLQNYDVHIFCYEVKKHFGGNPLYVTVDKLKDYNNFYNRGGGTRKYDYK